MTYMPRLQTAHFQDFLYGTGALACDNAGKPFRTAGSGCATPPVTAALRLMMLIFRLRQRRNANGSPFAVSSALPTPEGSQHIGGQRDYAQEGHLKKRTQFIVTHTHDDFFATDYTDGHGLPATNYGASGGQARRGDLKKRTQFVVTQTHDDFFATDDTDGRGLPATNHGANGGQARGGDLKKRTQFVVTQTHDDSFCHGLHGWPRITGYEAPRR